MRFTAIHQANTRSTPSATPCWATGLFLLCILFIPACDAMKKTSAPSMSIEEAIKQNNLKVVKAYASDMRQFGDEVFGRQYLMLASSYGHVKIVEYILDNGGDPGPYVKRRLDTPMHYAAGGNHPEVIEVLIAAGADVDARDNYGKTPLHWTADTDAADAARILLENGADPSPWSNFGTPLENAMKKNNQAVELVLREYIAK